MDKLKKIKITILTTVYNRKKLIKRLYESLANQTCFEFEWLIIDDGSKDNLELFINKIIEKETRFNIQYFYKENGGKHTALNYGISKAKGELLFIVDSDDFLLPKAIERIIYWEKTILSEDKVCGLGFCKGLNEKKLVGTTFECGEFLDATTLERLKYKITGDKAEIFYTNILRKYPFPEFENEKFLTEAVVWDKIAYDNFKIRWINEIIYICEYLDNGLSSKWNENLRNNPKGYTLFIKQKIHFNEISLKEKYLIIKRYHENIKINSKKKTCELLEFSIGTYLVFDFLFEIRKICRYLKLKKKIELLFLKLILYKKTIFIISQNCLGGLLYHDLNKQFNSPTINLYFNSSDFIKFVNNLEYYLSLDILFKEDTVYPIGVIDNIEIHFLHYKNNDEALKKWNNRKKRVIKDRLIILMTDRDGFSNSDFIEFKKIKYHKILFTCNEKWKNEKNVNYILKYKGNTYLPNEFLEMKDYINLKTLKLFFYYKKECLHY
ncbi:DUF1919 domain-containing protein [Thomasclavelia cocleata]|uniref:DUF1919 domain-containing protein n=1 Tax=Thomasclavelia cocleata TaxID=69824 RepID=UPI00255B2F81|nr:DUF1919 domain-containing protein [Thomasclavelia cocleata]